MNFMVFAAEEHANNFLYGDVKETIVAAVASVILFALLWWKGQPAAKKALADRITRIEKEIDDAEKARTDAETKLADVQTRIANAEQERQRILVEARQTAEALKTQIVARAEQEAEGIKTRAAADISASESQVVADLQAEVASLALGAAEAVVTNSLDAATQTELIDNYISQVGATGGNA